MNHLVFGVIAFSSASGVSLKPSSSLASTMTGSAPDRQNDVRIAHPIGRGDDDLVAGIERGEQGVVQHVLAAAADGDLVRLVVEAVLAGELFADRLLELGNAVDRGIFGLAALDGVDRRLLDVVGSVEIGLAGAKTNDVEAGGFHLARLVRDRHGRRRLDPFKRAGDQSHEELLEEYRVLREKSEETYARPHPPASAMHNKSVHKWPQRGD